MWSNSTCLQKIYLEIEKQGNPQEQEKQRIKNAENEMRKTNKNNLLPLRQRYSNVKITFHQYFCLENFVCAYDIFFIKVFIAANLLIETGIVKGVVVVVVLKASYRSMFCAFCWMGKNGRYDPFSFLLIFLATHCFNQTWRLHYTSKWQVVITREEHLIKGPSNTGFHLPY